ncbi:Uncharacterised protein [Cardiobacterium hominis]|uniref:Bacterial EndoU nuclease domain-containing protein n=1 Tax=Cardiobacterium hominis (strain ATCC 15826 / DSM 8339 / NCTC 10426 / 6573) TaxID=638300 RepID=C8NB22_CARH6|nr:hemagglutinin repeat-containing protein [Cardiobacterium hominis]EEV88188.1 hypothetical protein HMPREF0198_1700 [Cardiobacterium hominis ATCC 15826]VEG77979.1 Uncharacterised protein [Cardiobacterium hominis]
MSTILWVSILAAILAAGGHTEQENTNKQHVSSFNIGGLTSFIGSTRENGINIAATYAVQRSKTENDYHGNILTPSTIHAGGKVYLQAQGAGAESDINITGSDVAGKMGTHLKAEHQINLYAASEEHHENNYNQNYNAAAGVAARAGKNGVALGVTAEGGEGKGYSQANSNRWRGSHIGDADSQTTLQSGEATTLSGSQAIGKGVQIQASALNIESLQDTSDYKGRQEYKGAGGTAGWGYHSGSMDYSRSKLQGDATLVNRQAGVYAGDDGFQIDVAGATKNRGDIITSSKAAEEAGLNRFNTATLELEDIENHRNLKGSSISTSLGYTDGMEQEGQLNRGLGGGHIRENAYDTSRASINTQNITIRDEVAQQALTGESVGDTIARANQGIHTEDSAQHGSALTAIDNGEKLQRQLEADAEITREFGKIAPRAINDIAERRGNLREYEQQQLAKATAEEALTRTSDPAKRAALQNYINERDSYLAANKANYDYWKEGGSGRNLLHAASTALMSGTPEGALAGYTTSALSPTLNKLDNPLLNTVGGAAIGAAMSGNNPAVIAGAANTDWHNRQLHPTEMMLIEKNARTFAKQQGISEEEAISLLVGETLRGVSDDYADIKENQAARTFINQLPEAGKITNNGQHLFGVLDRESDEYRNSLYNIQHVEPKAKLYKQAPIVNNGFKDSTDYTLWLATYDDKNAYKKAGKEEVLGLYAGLEKRINDYRQKADELAYNNENGDEEQFKKAHEYIRNASTLHEATSANYPNASSLFTLAEFYNRDTAYSRIATGNIAESAGTSAISGGVRALNSAVNAARKIHPYRTTQETAGEIIKNKVLENIEISKQARESSNFTKYAENEVEFIEATNAKVIYPDRITFPSNLKNHLANVDGFKQNIGIKGGHNMNNFLSELSARNGAVVSKTPIADGIFEIKYKIPRLDRAGKPDGSYKIIKDPKTVYDPAKFSDEQMLKMAQEAAAKRYNEAIVNGWDQYSATVNGVTFRIYLDKSGAIRNVHPGQ